MAHESNGNGNGFLNGLPVWAKFVALIGVPGPAMMFLMWIMATSIDANVAKTLAIANELKSMQESHQESTRSVVELLNKQLSILRQMCANDAKDAASIARCVE